MDAVRRSRFASKQMRAGPAPLASFEDLPSDELESPEDYSRITDDSLGRDLQFSTPDSLTISSQSTPRIESDFDSQFTLTPGGDSYQGQSTSDLRTASLSSLSKEDSNTLNVKQKKGSAVSLGTLETPEVEPTHRKSSWTDIFKSHNQTSAKTSPVSQVSLSEKPLQKKSKSDRSKKDSDTKSKDKGKFLSIFKKKSNKPTNSPVSTDNYILPNESSNVEESFIQPSDYSHEDPIPSKIRNGRVSKGKENESPVDKELSQAPCEIQNDLGKVNSERCDKIPDERRFNRKVINIPENTIDKELNILSQQQEVKNIDKVLKTDNIQAIVDVKEDLESSESELTFEAKEEETEKEDTEKEDDFEAEILLSPDVSEIEEHPVIELQPVTFEVSKQLVLPSKQQRLEVTTKPIDRPRSTTPINVAPLEAFIQSVSPTFNGKVDKIKLSLPGEQFVGKVKSPKKSSMKSWTDFCERGLHSPRMHRKFDKDSQLNSFESSDGASLSRKFSSDNWAAFESDFIPTETTTLESNVFNDSFSADFNIADTEIEHKQESKESFESYHFESDFSCSPSSSGCASCSKFDSFGLRDAQSTDQSISSSPCHSCSCLCHAKQNSAIKSPEHCSNIDSFGASKVMSLVSDEQF